MDAWLEGLPADPIVALRECLVAAREAGLYEPEAAALATSTRDGRPSNRMVLVRRIDDQGLCFFTNLESRKAAELASNPRAALVFHWGPPLQRQVRAEGTVTAVSEEETQVYFRSRERTSRLGAWASPQSRPLADRDQLDARYAEAEARFAGQDDIQLPPFWGGYRLVSETVELWQNRPSRLHDRALYSRTADGWSRVRLAP